MISTILSEDSCTVKCVNSRASVQHGRTQAALLKYLYSLSHTHTQYFAYFNNLQPRDTIMYYKLHQKTVQLPTQCTYIPGLSKSSRNSAVKT
jgi:hypothetical protein